MGAISTSSPALWLKADAITGLSDGAAVTSWVDSSGNAKTAAQGNAAAQPVYKSGIQNGQPVVRFAGAQFLNSAASSSGSKSLAVAINATGTSFHTLLGSSVAGGFQARINGAYTVDILAQTNAFIASSGNVAVSSGEWHVIVLTYTNASAWSFYIDGVAAGSGTTATGVAAGGTAVIGTGGGNGAEFFAGDMGELATWDRVLTGTEVAAVTAELKAKWATADAPLQGVTYTADSVFSADWLPDYLGDGAVGYTGVPTRSWSPAGSSPVHWVRMQPAAPSTVTNYRLIARTDAPAYTPSAWTFEGSNDGTSWTVLDTRSAQTFTGGQARTYAATNSTAWTYYRLNITATANGQQSTFSELSLYAASTPTTPTTTGTSPVSVASSARTILASTTTGTSPVGVGSSSATTLVGITPVTTGTSPVTVASTSRTSLVVTVTATTGTAPITVGSSARTSTVGAPVSAEVRVGVKVETGALTLLHLVALPGVEVPVGLGVTAGDAQAVVPLPGVSIEIGCSLIARPVSVRTVDARGRRPQWRYVITDLANVPLGELVDLEHDPVEDGVGDPATMSFTVATASADSALIRPVERQCQVWDGDVLRLRGPILPGRTSDDGTAITYTVHDPSWFWRDGRRLIARIPQKNLLRNGDFKNDLAYWTAGYDRQSKPAAAPKVRVVSEDFADDTDGLNPIKAAEIVGVESFTESELSSNAVFWPNLASFRPGGVASVEAVANAMPTTAGLKVTVVGHTANDGTGNGLKLSERRAVAAAAIIKKKRPGAVITTKGVGFYDPKKGYPIGSQAQRRVVIQYDQTISGESLQWMRQRVEVTQPKEARYPLVLTAAAMLKVADDWSIEDANMMSVKVLARRKAGAKPPKSVADALAAAKVDYQSALTHLAEVKADKNHTADQLDSAREDVATAATKVSDAQNEAESAPWDLQLGVGSASISDTDPVDRWIPQTAEATIPADGRAYVVDVYLYAPAALARYTAVGLFPEEMLYFWGQDQASIFKGIMEHIQDPAFGHGDLGVKTRAPLTGVLRDREFAFRDLTPADTALDGLTAISRGLEWDTVTTANETTATTYHPRQGKFVDYVLAQGGNVAVAVPANTRDIGSNVIAQAQGLGSYRAVAYARDARAFGGTLLERVVTAEQDTPLNELGETAKAELHWARSSTPAYWVDIDPEFMEDVLANTAKGDTVRLILDYPTPVDALARIVRRQIHPDSLRLMVAFEEA